jgi:hypothetical protein
MAAQPKRICDVETVWLREYASTYLPNERAMSFTPEMLRREGVTLVDVRNALRNGTVTNADKIDGPDATWWVEGQDIDGSILLLTVVVVSETLEVSLCSVRKVVEREDFK